MALMTHKELRLVLSLFIFICIDLYLYISFKDILDIVLCIFAIFIVIIQFMISVFFSEAGSIKWVEFKTNSQKENENAEAEENTLKMYELRVLARVSEGQMTPNEAEECLKLINSKRRLLLV